jgi:hypothetical protein
MVKKLVLVEAISQYRMTYVMEVEDDLQHALDALTLGEATEEMSQEWLGETIFSHQEITDEQYLKIFNERNGYLETWTDDQKRKFIYRVDYSEGSVDE